MEFCEIAFPPPRHLIPIYYNTILSLRKKFLAASSQISTDPLIATPYGSPYGFVFPMKVRLVLDAAPLAVFPVIDELEIELSSGTYLKQSQVRIMGVTADSQNQGRTTIDIHLVSHGKKFDNTTAVLLSKRFWHNEVPLNRSLFGDYYLGSCFISPNDILVYSCHMLLPETKAVGIRYTIVTAT